MHFILILQGSTVTIVTINPAAGDTATTCSTAGINTNSTGSSALRDLLTNCNIPQDPQSPPASNVPSMAPKIIPSLATDTTQAFHHKPSSETTKAAKRDIVAKFPYCKRPTTPNSTIPNPFTRQQTHPQLPGMPTLEYLRTQAQTQQETANAVAGLLKSD